MSYSLKTNNFNTGFMARTKIHKKGKTWFQKMVKEAKTSLFI